MPHGARQVIAGRTGADGWPRGALRWLLALSIAVLGAPILDAAEARTALGAPMVVELCSGDGTMELALDPSGLPAHRDRHAGHDCPGCLAGCAKQPVGPMPSAGPTRPASTLWASPQPVASEATTPRPAARAPLPARGPPIRS